MKNKNYKIGNSWDNVLSGILISSLMAGVEADRARGKVILPTPDEFGNERVFRALELTPFDEVKVLIMGQDPYPDPNNACGLAFSSPSKIPASLKNIFNEAGVKNPKSGDLTLWAKQGVLLLNRALTFAEDETSTKRNKFFKPIIDEILNKLLDRQKPLVIMLWGNPANELIDELSSNHHNKNEILILRSSHPSPLGFTKAGKYSAFCGCAHFSKCNEFLRAKGAKEITWNLS